MSDEPFPCHWVNHHRRKVLIPGCMGAAVYGPEFCTCKNQRSALEDRVRRLEIQFARFALNMKVGGRTC